MKRWLSIAVAVAWTCSMNAADERFSQAVRPADFSAAGLSKLTPEELARLDALVGDFKTGALAAAREETAAAEAKAAEAEAEARAAKEKSEALQRQQAKPEEGLLSKAKVLLMPGTKVEYQPLESRIVGTISGWEPRMTFRLENGEQWRVVDDEGYYGSKLVNPAVRITPNAFGGFWMKIEGINIRVRVMPVVAKPRKPGSK